MNIRDVHEQAKGYFADWIRIFDDESALTVEDFPISQGVPRKVDDHCWRCITVNRCRFVTEVGKSPSEFDYESKLSLKTILPENRGLYHPNCHCKKQPIANPQNRDVKIVNKTIDKRNVFLDKITVYIKKKKPDWFYGWGYTDKDTQLYADTFAEKIKQEYIKGNYKIYKHDKFGVGINVFIDFPGSGAKAGHIYSIKSGWTVYPDWQLKPNTLIAGWNKA